MKDKFTYQSPFQKMFLIVFAFITSVSMALNIGTNRLDVSNGDSYASGTSYVIDCDALAGTMSTSSPVEDIVNGVATLTATADGNAIVPEGFTNVYVLTKGEELVIMNAGSDPSFDVTESGLYTIHSLVFNPGTLDLDLVQFGTTTGFEVFGLLVEGGGKICASLDVPGVQFKALEEQCTADAGTMITEMSTVALSNGTATISATANGDAIVPEGYANIYVLTQGEGLVILNAGPEPSFEVTEEGSYTIHSLVFDPNTLDLDIVDFGTTTGFTVFGLLQAGGGEICGSLDVAGAQFKVLEEQCTADAGTMSTDMPNVRIEGGTATLTASADGNAVIPDSYAQAFVLTQGEGLVILNYGFEPTFDVTEAGNYTIHSLVLDPNTLDVTIIEPGVTTGFDVFGLLIAGGGDICASLDVPGASFEVKEECLAVAGTMSTEMPNVELSNGTATISATANGDAIVLEGYANIYVLTQGEGLVILNAGPEPSFEVTEEGSYTIHSLVFDPNTLDLDIVDFGTTTGFTVFGLLQAGGGEICGSLDVAGAQFKVLEEQCTAEAGTMSTEMPNVELANGTATISAMATGDAIVPEGYANIYVLTQGEGLVILNAGPEPSFEVTEAGDYTIHSLVFDPNTLDLDIVEFGTTTGFTVFGLLQAGGGEICGSLDVAGAQFKVSEEQCTADAGTMSTEMPNVELSNGTATISAIANGDAIVPEGYANIYVLTQGEGLVILNAGPEPSFEVTEAGDYTIHSLVFDPNTLDLDVVDFGTTTGFTVFGLLQAGGGEICGSLDVAGAQFKVSEEQCTADAGTMSTEMPNVRIEGGTATLTASADGNAVIPDGFAQAFVLTQGEGLVILNYGFEPTFDVTEAGNYTIHSLVLDPNTLDVTIIEPGVTTGFDVFGLLIAGGGDICASLDVPGASFEVKEECLAVAGTMSTEMPNVELSNGTATISATANGDAIVPEGYANIYVLTQGEGLVILNAGPEPSFEVTEAGDYTIHSLVFDPNTLDLDIVDFGTTTGFTVFGLLQAGGGDICGSLDVAGAQFKVSEEQCTADAGTMTSEHPISCLDGGMAMISAEVDDAPVIPDGYQQIFVLTRAFTLTILDASAVPEFSVDHPGFYRIHSLVYNPETLNLGIVEFGTTTGFDVLHLVAQNNICASLDVHGALNLVVPSWICHFYNNLRIEDETALIENYMDEYDNYQAFENAFKKDKLDIRMYPNPTASDVNLEADLVPQETINYTVVDVSGRVMLTGQTTALQTGNMSIYLSRLKDGTYFVRFESQYRNFTKAVQVKR